MWNLNQVRSLRYCGAYVFRIEFDDGLAADVDLEPLLALGPVFEPLRDLSLFRQAFVEGGTIAWPNGADIAPESLYERTLRARASQLA